MGILGIDVVELVVVEDEVVVVVSDVVGGVVVVVDVLVVEEVVVKLALNVGGNLTGGPGGINQGGLGRGVVVVTLSVVRK